MDKQYLCTTKILEKLQYVAMLTQDCLNFTFPLNFYWKKQWLFYLLQKFTSFLLYNISSEILISNINLQHFKHNKINLSQNHAL